MSFKCQQLQITKAGKPLFQPLSFDLAKGQMLAIMGPSGVGKSSLLSAIAGTLDPVFHCQGEVTLNGQNLLALPLRQRQVGLMFQDDLLFPHFNVEQNLAFALPPALSRAERQHKIQAALAHGDLKGFEQRDITTLSGGQRARVSLLRCLLAAPALLLLDEPYAKLDKSLKGSFSQFVLSHIQQANIPAILVSHDADDANGWPIIELTSPKP
ncbi:ATP-binding cassette domain-containing protein [Motilimonas eburnea]|uniref:ATP-binding cassette domain-containing protein n=1 Tax=Motilimonas eburnea TaxID=1737488 RepID=UPI001E5E96D0|nr:ATP-binding cassette domain-containing protein [Motilimonas eburnea]MCE2572565.1 ATP-binding cassette domain-containing protein [Motilimonas eburnea]